MKKVLFSGVMMLFLMSFSNKVEEQSNKGEMFSPECFEFADSVIEELNMAGWSFNEYEVQHSFWEAQYNWCESTSDHDEFQFLN